ncbi:hypothetical protein N7468_000774 [Penicillium chermesinum]|uniref:Major facilitator superfamily (MFS) profile domain-containing protein n=1 Tax=Penicillium chermesinum TaxID=63820 RepID=A0A9W9PFB8_9EURO|nr:uncharacterized protein N7468_000774 [Penicillium chermesinum]KAJ5245791.1 hypothetical protein N7468_000774 [Penicillium chermesinum]KAJ6144091.1 hypothetical protein N7470_007986 [Penicillium chermesinum]
MAETTSKKPWLLSVRSSERFIIIVVTMAMTTDVLLYSLIIPIIPKSLVAHAGVPEKDAQYWISVLLAVYACALLVGSPVIGYAADHVRSRQLPFVLGLAALAVSTGLFALANSPGTLVIARACQGLSAATVWVVGLAMLVDNVAPERMGEAMGNTSTGMTLGSLLGPMLGGVTYDEFGYYGVFILPSVMIILEIVLRLTMIEKSTAKEWDDGSTAPKNTSYETFADGFPRADPQNEQSPLLGRSSTSSSSEGIRNGSKKAPILQLLSSARLLTSLLVTATVGFTLGVVETTIPLFVMENFQWSSKGAGLIFLALSIPSLTGGWVGRALDRIGTRGAGFGSLVVTGTALFSLRFVQHDSDPDKALLVGLLVVIGFTVLMIQIISMTEVFQAIQACEEKSPGIFGDKSPMAQAYALFNMATATGQLTGPLVGGLVRIHAGWAGMTLTSAILCFLVAVPVARYTGSPRPKKGDEQSTTGHIEA